MIDYGITYTDSSDSGVLTGYTNSDWAGDTDDRRSTAGYLFLLNSGPISWYSKKQGSITLSSAEAEYMALSAAAQEAIYLRNLLDDLGLEQCAATVIYVDNCSAIAMARNPG